MLENKELQEKIRTVKGKEEQAAGQIFGLQQERDMLRQELMQVIYVYVRNYVCIDAGNICICT